MGWGLAVCTGGRGTDQTGKVERVNDNPSTTQAQWPDDPGPPVLRVHLSDDGKLSYKAPGKGARWRGGFNDLSEVVNDADNLMPESCVFEFVETRD